MIKIVSWLSWLGVVISDDEKRGNNDMGEILAQKTV